jgi:signal transduction histidine kinase/ligand-binding sensor domain-containing protein
MGPLRTLRLALAIMLLAGRAFALDPSLDVSQYAHTVWKIRDGFTSGYTLSITQTPDGYLWLGTELGLVRFDGVRVVPWQPPAGQQLPSNNIRNLLVTRDGTLWIGTYKGLASWKNGQFTTYSELSRKVISALLQDREDTIWVGTTEPPSAGRLCTIRTGRVQCEGGDGLFGSGINKQYEDSKGNLWLQVQHGFWKWKPGRSEFFATREFIQGGFAQDDQSTLLIGTLAGLRQFVNGGLELYSLPGMPTRFQATRMRRDHEGGIWIGTVDRGLLHIHHGKTDTFSEADGLSGDDVINFFEDREGNMWVATSNGLDRFRDYAVPNISIKQGLSNTVANSVVASRDGNIWIATTNGLNRWHNGQISVILHGSYNTLFQDGSGRIWASSSGKFGYLENDQFVPVRDLPGRAIYSTTEAPPGDLWVSNQEAGLLHLRREQIVQQIPWAALGHNDVASVVAADPSQRGVWLGFFQGGVSYFADGGVKRSYSAAQGLGQGSVRGLRFGPRGALWVATDGGLSRIKDGQISTLTSKNGLPCDTVHWSMEDDDHVIWLYMACGLVRIPKADLDTWVKDPTTTVKTRVFDISDGVLSHAVAPMQGVTKSPDGKIWFATFDGVSVIDPHRLAFNELPPPLHIEQITADRKTYDATSGNGNVRLPPRVRDLQIDYTALSLVVPEKVRFRYKLEGFEGDWQDAGTRRQAFYTNLPPRNYTFRVMASNNSGVWNEAGTSLAFSVAPAYYQTWWFRSLCVVGFLALVGGFYQLRLQQLARQFNMRLEERVSERTRIARDLHDTLLQSFQGVLLKFHAVTYVIKDRPAEAQKTLETVIEQARQAITEGRDAVQGLRSSTVVTSDLARVISTFGQELCAPHAGQNPPNFLVHVEGKPRDLAPLIGDEIYRIAGEALRNAFRHSDAARIEVEIRFDRRQLRLRVRDNGKGIDPKLLDGDGRAGHFGLPGMHERARLVGGKLAIWSQPDSGTEAELTIPASVAYAKSQTARRSKLWARGA